MHFGVDVKKFKPVEKDYNGIFRVAFSGNVNNRKGIPYLIKAWKELNLKDAELNIYGRVYPEVKKYFKDAEKYNIKWAQPNDPRITKIGRFLRKTGLDELPQLFNILKGDMSFVGPRPIRKDFAILLTQYCPDYPKRFLVKPGITGYAQLYAPYGSTIEEQLKKIPYDQKYLSGLSISEYFKILFKTVLFVIKGRKW